ncbi:MAG: hypothetical protein M3O71_09260, partial [Bacteroidota bacterium]|nr:hypothetical protein [Bacteroidota bacterium]
TRALHKAPAENLKLLKRSIAVLNDSCRKLDGDVVEVNSPKVLSGNPDVEPKAVSADDLLLKEQLGFINKISTDIARVTESIVN